MKVFIVMEYKDYYDSEIVKVFSKEQDAIDFVEKNYWQDHDNPGIFYEEHEVL